jgi:hypothetical protein
MKQCLLIATVLLAIVCSPATFAEIGAERPVSTPVYAPVTSVRGEGIASDGKQFMAVWIDERSRWRSVYASRIAPDGTVLDPLGILIGTSDEQSLGIAWNGESYWVVWGLDHGIMIASLSPEGRVVVPAFRIVTDYLYDDGSIGARQLIASNSSATVITTGSGWLVIHELERVVERHSFLSSGTFRSVYRTGEEFTLVPGRDGGVAARLDSKGQLVRTAKTAAAASAISCREGHCIQVYPDAKGNHLQVVSYDGVAEATGTPVELPITAVRFALVGTSSGYLLVTNDNSMQRFDAQGMPAGVPVPPCCPRAISIAAASDGVNVAVLRLVDSKLSVTMVTPSGTGAPRNVAMSANSQFQPAITGNGSNYLVAWRETDGAYFGRVGLDGTILDGRGKHLSSSDYGKPSLAFDGTSYIVATSTSPGLNRPGQVTITRIDPATGTILNVSTTCGGEMRIGRNEHATVAVWIDCTGNLDIADIDATGALSPAHITLALTKSPYPLTWLFVPFLANPQLAWNGSEWLVTWEEQTFVSFNLAGPTYLQMTGLQGMPVSALLTPSGWQSQLLGFINDYATSPYSARLASDGHDFLAVWDESGATVTCQIATSGAPIDIVKPAVVSSVTDIVWDGTSYSTAYIKASRSDYGQWDYSSRHFYQNDLVIAPLSASGKTDGFAVISATNDDEYDAALFSLGGGRVAVAYVRVAHEALYGGAERVFFTKPVKSRGRAARSVMP